MYKYLLNRLYCIMNCLLKTRVPPGLPRRAARRLPGAAQEPGSLRPCTLHLMQLRSEALVLIHPVGHARVAVRHRPPGRATRAYGLPCAAQEARGQVGEARGEQRGHAERGAVPAGVQRVPRVQGVVRAG